MLNETAPHPSTDRLVGGGLFHSAIIAALKQRGAPITHLSERMGLGRTTLQAALYQPYYVAGHRIIAATLGMSLHQLFPAWYGPDNQPLLEKAAS